MELRHCHRTLKTNCGWSTSNRNCQHKSSNWIIVIIGVTERGNMNKILKLKFNQTLRILFSRLISLTTSLNHEIMKLIIFLVSGNCDKIREHLKRLSQLSRGKHKSARNKHSNKVSLNKSGAAINSDSSHSTSYSLQWQLSLNKWPLLLYLKLEHCRLG